MSILVLGGEGMLGHKMYQSLLSRFPDARCTIMGSLSDPFYRAISLFNAQRTIEGINAMDLVKFHRKLEVERPEFVVNCIGIVKQRNEAKSAVPSITINALLPHLLSDWTAAWSGRLIHFSTDCVFSGKTGHYREDDPSDAEDLYGRSKFLGEVRASNTLTLRTSIIGRELNHFNSLLEWFLAQRGKRVRGFRRVIYSGVTTNYLAELVGSLITHSPTLSGLYQITAPPISKHDLLCRLRTAYQINVDIEPDDSEFSDRSMNGELFRKVTGYNEPQWDDLIAGLTEDSTPYKSWAQRS